MSYFGIPLRNSAAIGIGGNFSLNQSGLAPSLNLDFTTGILDPRITFTRASTATYTGSDGLIKTAAINTPRFDYNPVTGESKGLLIEEQRTNLLTYSEQFDNAVWSKYNVSVVANASIAPDGTATADSIIEDTATNSHYATNSYNETSGVVYNLSCFLKTGQRTFCFLVANGSGTLHAVSVNLSNGLASTATGSPTNIISTNVGNGWYRISFSYTSGTTGAVNHEVRLSTDGVWANRSYTGNGTGNIYAWGAQLEVGAFPTSYIPTVASQVTRSADSASMTGSNFSSWYNQSEGTLFGEFAIPPALSAFPSTLGAVSDGTTQNQASMYAYTSGLYTNVKTGNVAQGDPGVLATPVVGANAKYATALALNNTVSAWNRSVGIVDNAISLPTVNQLRLGTNGAGSGYINSHIKRLAYYPRRLSNSELQGITS